MVTSDKLCLLPTSSPLALLRCLIKYYENSLVAKNYEKKILNSLKHCS